jgi:DNA-binding response OmpR family regulator
MDYFELMVDDVPVGLIDARELAKLSRSLRKILSGARRLPSADVPRAQMLSAASVVARLFLGDGPMVFEVGGLKIDAAGLEVRDSNNRLHDLSSLEFKLLRYLARRPNSPIGREELLKAIWGSGRTVAPRIVDVFIRRLRAKVEADPGKPTLLTTVKGLGYMFVVTEGDSAVPGVVQKLDRSSPDQRRRVIS